MDLPALALKFLTEEVFYGAIIWGALAALFKYWKHQWGDPADWAKILITVVVLPLSVMGVYYLGVQLRWFPPDNDLRDNALTMSIAVLVAKLIFAITTGVQEATGDRPKTGSRVPEKEKKQAKQAVKAKPRPQGDNPRARIFPEREAGFTDSGDEMPERGPSGGR